MTDPWGRGWLFTIINEWLLFMGFHVGKYTIVPLDPMEHEGVGKQNLRISFNRVIFRVRKLAVVGVPHVQIRWCELGEIQLAWSDGRSQLVQRTIGVGAGPTELRDGCCFWTIFYLRLGRLKNKLVGGFKDFIIFIPKIGEMIQFWLVFFQNGLKPLTSECFWCLPSRDIHAYPTLIKWKSSTQKCIVVGDMLVPWSVHYLFENLSWFQLLVISDMFFFLGVCRKQFLFWFLYCPEVVRLVHTYIYIHTWIFPLCVKFVRKFPQKKPTNFGRNATYLPGCVGYIVDYTA